MIVGNRASGANNIGIPFTKSTIDGGVSQSITAAGASSYLATYLIVAGGGGGGYGSGGGGGAGGLLTNTTVLTPGVV